jgi:HK97 family phage portal protein
MAVLQNIWDKLTGKQPSHTPNPLDAYLMKVLANNAIYPDESAETYLSSYTGNNDVFTVINKITEPASTVPIFQYDENGEIVENGKMLARLNNPNGYQSRSQFIEAGMSFFLIFGNCFTSGEEVEGSAYPGFARLDQLPPQWIAIKLGTYFNPVTGYSFYPFASSSAIDYPKENIYHWKEFNPDYSITGGHLKGMSRLRPLLRSVTGSKEAYNSLVKAFQNQGMWGLLAMIGEDDKITQLTKEQKSKLRSEFARDSATGKLTIVNKKVEYTNMGLTMRELEVVKSLGILKGNLCDAYNVPSQLLSGSQDRTYNNYKEAERALWTNAICPNVDAYLEGLSKWMAPHFQEDGNVLKADYSGVEALNKNIGEIVTAMVTAGIFTGNQILEAIDWETSEDPNMERIITPVGRMFMDEMGMPPDPQVTENVMKRLGISDYRK